MSLTSMYSFVFVAIETLGVVGNAVIEFLFRLELRYIDLFNFFRSVLVHTAWKCCLHYGSVTMLQL